MSNSFIQKKSQTVQNGQKFFVLLSALESFENRTGFQESLGLLVHRDCSCGYQDHSTGSIICQHDGVHTIVL
jgi:hypothetical protein